MSFVIPNQPLQPCVFFNIILFTYLFLAVLVLPAAQAFL